MENKPEDEDHKEGIEVEDDPFLEFADFPYSLVLPSSSLHKFRYYVMPEEIDAQIYIHQKKKEKERERGRKQLPEELQRTPPPRKANVFLCELKHKSDYIRLQEYLKGRGIYNGMSDCFCSASGRIQCVIHITKTQSADVIEDDVWGNNRDKTYKYLCRFENVNSESVEKYLIAHCLEARLAWLVRKETLLELRVESPCPNEKRSKTQSDLPSEEEEDDSIEIHDQEPRDESCFTEKKQKKEEKKVIRRSKQDDGFCLKRFISNLNR